MGPLAAPSAIFWRPEVLVDGDDDLRGLGDALYELAGRSRFPLGRMDAALERLDGHVNRYSFDGPRYCEGVDRSGSIGLVE
jgi:hypothetical protein